MSDMSVRDVPVRDVPVRDVPGVSVVAHADKEKALYTIVTAFAADPLTRWVVPQADNYVTYGVRIFDAFGGAAFAAGSAYEVSGFAGVALWVPPGHEEEAAEEAFARTLVEIVAPERLDEVTRVLDEMQSYHPVEPCWYLPLIGVDPCHQGQGFGAKLMKYALAQCDAQGLPAYLESSNPANITLYERHGFELMGRIQSASSPPVHPMYRAAR